MNNQQIDRLLEHLDAAVKGRVLVRLVLSNPRDRTAELRSVTVTLVGLKAGMRASFVYRFRTKDITKNLPEEEVLTRVREALEKEFTNADLFTTAETVQLMIHPSGKVTLKATPATPAKKPDFSHDHVKERLVGTDQNIYLKELGILNANFEVRREMADKYRQINRYIELLGPALADLRPEGPVRVADMGSGKGYLTFALYDHLRGKMGLEAVVTGVEAREGLVSFCNEVAGKSGFTGLNFIRGSIEETEFGPVDILIALHACDTATDDAIFRGIRSGAELIVCAPCCHKQVRNDLLVTAGLKPLLKHGILMERQAEILTDGLRALLMESQGYKTRVVEFVSTEHTPKNLMIIGRKSAIKKEQSRKILEQITLLKETFGIGRLRLEELLG